MRCHYEVLSVARDADDADIKSAYKKLALKWHPDKNLNDAENAKEQFQLIQQAYEILSDKHERAWYDRHREQILRGGNSEFADSILDVFQYFTTSCFKGYTDDEKGFYTVYRNVFEQIAKEDLDFYEDKEEFTEIPSFGTSTSDYDTIVHPFYTYWMSYSTKKSYVWLDPYDIKEIRDRRISKAVEKENKKVRQKAKKERNEEIRNLVAFVRKRDKRVQAWNKMNDEKIEENRKRQEVLRKQKMDERRKMNESQVQAEWTKFENVSSELHEIEKNLAKEFGNSETSDSEEFSDLYCAACNKLFKTIKSFQNHESSKKHRENVELLKAHMLEEEEAEIEESLSSSSMNGDLPDELKSELSSGQRQVSMKGNEACSSEEETEEMVNIPRRKKTKKSKPQHMQNLDSDSEEISTNIKKPKKKNRNVLKVESSDDELKLSTLPASTSSDDELKQNMEKTKKKGRNKRDKARKTNNETKSTSNNKENSTVKLEKDEITIFTCATCSKIYPSKNKLFQHLKAESHGVYLSSSSTASKHKGSRKK